MAKLLLHPSRQVKQALDHTPSPSGEEIVPAPPSHWQKKKKERAAATCRDGRPPDSLFYQH